MMHIALDVIHYKMKYRKDGKQQPIQKFVK